MANSDLVKKKPVALEVATYERLSKLAAQMRIDSPGGSFVSMSAAVGLLLDTLDVVNQLNAAREEWVKAHPKSTASFVIEPGDTGGFQLWRIEEGDYADQIWHDITSSLEPVNETK